MATIAEAVNRLVLLRSSDQGTPLEQCEESTNEYSEEENMEPQGKEEGLEHDIQQEEEKEVCEPEENKEELGEIDQDEDSIIDDFLSSLVNPLNDPNEPLPIEFERDMEVDFSQPPCYDLSDGE
ncbi:FK506-binding protein 3-like [Arachis duranensis]|uniref:FK506-binding protein 3-like n=1 Tax=Arachis duranensis TaxID=130453 RepID=A0A6P4C5S8_ARADU|nr:FK506-binding protein 3-like [Arachis duranensis]